MGLAQKRISQEFQTTVFPEWKKAFDGIVGFEIPMEVKWDTMLSDDRSDKNDYFEWYKLVYFKPLTAVFTGLCADSMGKEAVKAGVKKIVIDGSEGTYGTSSQFENGTFFVKHKFDTNVDNYEEREKYWKEMIELKL